ncbi:MAG: hypothetical protein AAF298_06160 [Cyanobacteria bacterium P01_A01_bin.40]
MKTDNRNFVFSWFNTLLVAGIIGFLIVTAVKAENNLDLDTLNGLFTPTQSERFFQAGRENFKHELEILSHPERYLWDDSLQIDPELLEQMNDKQTLDLKFENSQYTIDRDSR